MEEGGNHVSDWKRFHKEVHIPDRVSSRYVVSLQSPTNLSRSQAEVIRRVFSPEVRRIDVQRRCEADLVRPAFRLKWAIWRLELSSFGQICEGDLERCQRTHNSSRRHVKRRPCAVLKFLHLDHIVISEVSEHVWFSKDERRDKGTTRRVRLQV